jgi:hypothetical protein
MPPEPLPPSVHAEVHRILAREARRLLNQHLDLFEKESRGTLNAGEREYLGLLRKKEAGALTDAEQKRLSDYESLSIRTDTTDA